MKEVSISVGTTADNTEILPWTLIDVESFVDATASVPVTIPDGVNGWVKLRAVNNGKMTENNSFHHSLLSSY